MPSRADIEKRNSLIQKEKKRNEEENHCIIVNSIHACSSTCRLRGSTAQTADTSADAAGEAESAQGDPATVTEKETNVSATADADLSGTTITFWHSMSGVNGEALTALVDRFNEENTYGITVDAEFEGEYDDAINKLKSSMVGGKRSGSDSGL